MGPQQQPPPQQQLQHQQQRPQQQQPQALHLQYQQLQVKPPALEPVKQPPLLARVVSLDGAFLEMSVILPRQPQQPPLTQQLLAKVVFWAGVSLVVDVTQKPQQPQQPPL